MPTAMTVSLDKPDVMATAARALADVPLIKIKVDRSDPETQIHAVREVAPHPRIIVDPNESWTIDEVSGLQQLLMDLRVDLLEQPLPADDLAGHALADLPDPYYGRPADFERVLDIVEHTADKLLAALRTELG